MESEGDAVDAGHTDDPELFRAQTKAIGALARFLAGHAGDWRSVLGGAG